MPSSTIYNLMEACREPGCPVCRLEQQSVERYLDNQFYENVNSPAWRSQLRASHGFCHEHAWLAVSKRLGDALGFTIIYHDLMNHLLRSSGVGDSSLGATKDRRSVLGGASESLRKRIDGLLEALTPRKRCPVCDHREAIRRDVLTALAKAPLDAQMHEALESSDGLCIPHLRLALGHVRDLPVYQGLLAIHRAKWEGLRNELAEFIRKSDYQVIQEGFGTEGNAWLRAIGMLAGSRRER